MHDGETSLVTRRFAPQFIALESDTMASVFELAKLSAIAYKSNIVRFREWTRKEFIGNYSGKGFYAEIFSHSGKNEVVVSYRGTDGGDMDWDDFFSDLQIGLGKIPYQYKEAVRAFSMAKELANSGNRKIIVTGHSLGGGLASLVSAKEEAGRFPTVTFNAPGMKNSYVGSHFLDLIGHFNLGFVDQSKFLHIRATGDLVSKVAGGHIGKVENVYVDEWGDSKILGGSRHLAQHSIDNIVKTLERNSWYHRDITVA